MSSIVDSIRSAAVPIRREGWPFVAVALILAVGLGWLWAPLFWLGLVVAAWCAYFFRDPPRVTPLDDELVVSPADGRIARVAPALPPVELMLGSDRMTRVSVFMSIFDCHVNRSPVTGRVERIAYRAGRFLNAELDKASEHNERNGMALVSAHGAIGVVQIAGLVARRIACFAREGDRLSAGDRIGLIRFGSRLDVYLPPEARVEVLEGQRAIAGETVIARFDVAPRRAASRVG